MHEHALDLRAVVVFLVAAGLIVPLMARISINPVIGFLAVGIAIGPYGLARLTDHVPALSAIVITDLEGVRALAELGVVFLLFMIGLELSLDRLWQMRRLVFGVGAAQVVITAFVIGGLVYVAAGEASLAVVVGAGLALSSTAIVVELLVRNRRLGSRVGQTTFAILLFQDLAVLPILLIVSALAATGGGSVPLTLATALLQASVVVVAIMFAGRLVIRPFFRLVGQGLGRDIFLASVLLVIIGMSVLTEKVGLSLALGAFLAGLLFAETEYRHAVETDIEPFKGLLLALFFVSVGMGIDLMLVLRHPMALIGAVVALFVVKGIIVYALARLSGRTHGEALEVALLLGQGGEFGFLIVGLAVSLALIGAEAGQFILLVTGVSMVVTPVLAIAARRIGASYEARTSAEMPDAEPIERHLEGHVIVVGYGRVGRMLGDLLEQHGIAHIAIDNDPVRVAAERRAGASVVFGDARQTNLLEHIGIEAATALVVTMDNARATELVVTTVHAHWPALTIVARARDAPHARRLLDLGAQRVVPETVEASLQIGELVLSLSGLPAEVAHRIVNAKRDMELEKIGTVAGEEEKTTPRTGGRPGLR
ncbi:MAG: cation:proton antiporter [Hyphomicrobiaceae bacterium]